MPFFNLDTKNSIVHNFSLHAETPTDTNYIVALSFLRQNNNTNLLLYNISTILENIDLFQSQFLIPVDSFAQTTGNSSDTQIELKNIIDKYSKASPEERKLIKEENGDKLVFFSRNKNQNIMSGFNVYDNEKISSLMSHGILNSELFFRPLKGELQILGNSSFLPLCHIKLNFGIENESLNGMYMAHEVMHKLSNNQWSTTLSISKNLFMTKQMLLKGTSTGTESSENFENEQVNNSQNKTTPQEVETHYIMYQP